MKLEKIRAGVYRAQLVRPGDFLWVIREGHQKWTWYVGGYSDYEDRVAWALGKQRVFKTMKEAVRDAIAYYAS